MKLKRLFFATLGIAGIATLHANLFPSVPAGAPEGWQTASPRAEITPMFSCEPDGGRAGKGALVIQHDSRDGLDGFWTKTFPVTGGRCYRFEAFRQTQNIALARQSAIVRLLWRDDKDKKVLFDEAPNARHSEIPSAVSPTVRYETNVLSGAAPVAEAEYPLDKGTNANGWTEVSDVYRAPAGATRAVVELHLQWAPRGKIEWSDVSLTEVPAPEPRMVRLAAVHFRPPGKSPAENCRAFAPLIEEAARQHADLVVLPETLTLYGTKLSYAECAEPIPGPSTEYFGRLARQYDLYLVAGLVERDRHLVYNVAVLIAPDGRVAGKYRKVALPRDEVAAGVAPGNEYPVFDTRFGRLGMMVCYDGFFPEVARQLSLRGAEVIAWPVWGCNQMLASARACDNHVYLVSSSYEPPSAKWMLTAVWDQDGQILAKADHWGAVVVSEVDLNQRTYWPSLGDWKGDLMRHRPEWKAEDTKP